MSHRFLASTCALAVVSAMVFLMPAAAFSQSWTLPRTPDGQPDLQGYWTNATYTPLERSANAAGKEFFTEEEFDAMVRQSLERAAEQTQDRITGEEDYVHYDFGQFGLTRDQDGYVRNLRTSLVTDPPDGKLPPVNAEGQQRAAARAEARRALGGPYDAVQNMGLATRCIIWGADPPMMPIGYNSNYQILQTPDYVVILVEMNQDVRIIPLDGRPQLPENIRQLMGSSRGRWEGDTLIVETTNLTDKTAFRGSSQNMRVIERFTRVSDERLVYEFTVEDPATWDRPWSAEIPMLKTVGPIFEFACHEGNYGVMNILAGARAEEQRAAEEAAKTGQ